MFRDGLANRKWFLRRSTVNHDWGKDECRIWKVACGNVSASCVAGATGWIRSLGTGRIEPDRGASGKWARSDTVCRGRFADIGASGRNGAACVFALAGVRAEEL